jgi:hypothetical protein
MTKQEKIKEAYGEYWEEIRSFVNDEGYFDNIRFSELKNYRVKLDYCDFDMNNNDFYVPMWRPKSLQGIENNNGWIKIESEADFPKETRNTQYHVFKFSNQYKHIINNFSESEVKYLWEQEEITHYQPITKPQPPIY